MPHNYPLLLNVSDRLIVIVGGGEVAVRKACGLVDAGASKIRVVAPSVHERMPAMVQLVRESYRSEHLAGAGLVFASTDDASVNDQVVRDAHALNLLVCRADADDANAGDFATPAVIRRGSALLTVSTGGSPALTANWRDAIEHNLDERFVKMADLMQTLRPQILAASSLPAWRRRELFRWLASNLALKVLENHGKSELLRLIVLGYPELENQLI